MRPTRVLEVGSGTGELAARIATRARPRPSSRSTFPERMVELTRARGVEARVGDVCALPFEAEAFDCVAANWMLYHARDIDLAVAELARVLRPGGRLVAVTNSTRHLEELWSLVGAREDDRVTPLLRRGRRRSASPATSPRSGRRDVESPITFRHRPRSAATSARRSRTSTSPTAFRSSRAPLVGDAALCRLRGGDRGTGGHR